MELRLIACLGLTVLLLVSCFPFLVTAEASWLEGYEKRVLFYWESSGAGQDCFTVYNQTGINQNSKFFIYNETQADFRDLRVTLSDGETLLPIWNQTTINGESCKVWAKFPTANTSYYLYWNNPTATSIYDKNTVFTVIDNALGVWDMNDPVGATALYDSTGYGKNATLYGTTVDNDQVFPGKNMRVFNGNTDYAIVADASGTFNLLNNFSVVVWGKLNANIAHAFVWKAASNYNPVYGIGQTSATMYSLAFASNSSGRYFVNNQLASYGNNQFMVSTFNGSDLLAYSNGSLLGSLKIAAPLANGGTNALAFGARNSTTDGLMRINGTISYIAIFGQPLTQSEVSAFYNGFGDASFEQGKVYVRAWVLNSNVSLFGFVESAPDPDFISGEDAAGIAVFFGVVAIAFCVALVFGKRK